jgi:hypothetical protein
VKRAHRHALRRAGAGSSAVVAVVAVVVSALATGLVAVAAGSAGSGGGSAGASDERRAPRQTVGDGDELSLLTQTFAVSPGAAMHLELDVPSALATQVGLPASAATTTTSTTTTTTTTTTTIAPTTVPGSVPPGEATAALPVEATSPVDPASPAGATTLPSPTTVPPPPDPLDGVDVVVTAYERIELRSQVADVYAGRRGDQVDGARFELAGVLVAEASGNRRIVLDVPVTARGEVMTELALPASGLYPVTVELQRDGRRVGPRHTTFVERLGVSATAATDPTFTMSVLAGIDDPGPTVDDDQLLSARADLLELAELAETVSAPITVAVPPTVAQLTDEDPQLRDRLATALAGDEAIALPAAELDPSSAVAAGQEDVFTRTLRDGQDVLTRALRETPNSRTTWTSATPVSEPAAAMLRDLGAQLLVVPYDVYAELDGSIPGYTDTSMLAEGLLPDDSTLPVAIVDEVAALLDPDREVARTPAEDAVQVMAELVAMRIQLGSGDRNVVLATPTLGIPDGDVLAYVEQFATEDPAMGFRLLSAVPGATDTIEVSGDPLRLVFPATAGPDITDRVGAIDDMRLYAASTASMLPRTDPRRTRWAQTLDTLVSTGITDEEATDALEALRVELDAVGAAIDPPAPFTFTMTGRSSEITLRFSNTGDTPLLVRVRVSSTKLAFGDADVEVELAPNATTDVDVDVTSLTNGTFPVAVEVFTPLGGQVGEAVPLTARVNAISGLGKLLTGGAVLVLATWWLSHFRRRRRARLERASVASRELHPSRGRPLPTIEHAATNGNGHAPVEMADDVSPDAAEAGGTGGEPAPGQ